MRPIIVHSTGPICLMVFAALLSISFNTGHLFAGDRLTIGTSCKVLLSTPDQDGTYGTIVPGALKPYEGLVGHERN